MNKIKKHLSLLFLSVLSASSLASDRVFLYSPAKDGGVRLAWASDGAESFSDVGQIFQSDYAQWGADKKMYSPYFIRLAEGGYASVFQVNDIAPCFAVAYSDDLYTWRPQDYPRMSHQGVIAPVIVSCGNGRYDVVYRTLDGLYRKCTTDSSFRHFSSDVPATAEEYAQADQKRSRIVVGDKEYVGNLLSIDDGGKTINAVREHFRRQGEAWQRSQETLGDDDKRFASLIDAGILNARLKVNAGQEKVISDKLIGIFFEDISYAADGGLYAEMVQNRDFEYTPGDHKGWHSSTSWSLASGAEPRIITSQPLSKQNPHALVITADTLYNTGWDGMSVKKDALYDFSFYVLPSAKKNFIVAIVDETGKVIAKTTVKTRKGPWCQYTATLRSSADCRNARLMIVGQGGSECMLDMVSLFPRDTFRGRKNGLRRDLAETIERLKPKFVRFPGGCMSHGNGLDNIYHWNHTVGPLQERTPDRNIWHYHQTRGLGFYEYFQFCEDIGAEPLPVLAAGVPCQNSAADKCGYGGQQGGIPMDQMPAYIQEILDMIEWANGDPATSRWAKMRADAGHPEPFHLKYIGIGNEDIISTVFEERCEMICRAIREKYPDIQICGTAGPFHSPSSDYVEGWRFANAHRDLFDLIDEHYYESVGWFLDNQHYYDAYDRSGAKVYLGEYAARSRRGNIDCALVEALYLCGIERNGDIVSMTSYAPMLCHLKHQNWNPDMIYFDNDTIVPTPSYETQRMFSVYGGDRYVSTSLSLGSEVTRDKQSDVLRRVNATVVRDHLTGKSYLKVVNVLPVSLSLNVSGVKSEGGMRYEQINGRPGQERVVVEKGECGSPSSDGFTIVLPPYSFRAIEL